MREMFDGLDPAAIHPRLNRGFCDRPGSGHYFRQCRQVREEIKSLIATVFRVPHDLFIVNNSTSGLLAALFALTQVKATVSCREECLQTYPPYRALFAGPCVDTGKAGAIFVTHVSPLTGRVAALDKGPGQMLVVDGAQSFGTDLTDDLLATADIFVAPFHKHVGLTVGAGLLGLRRDIAGYTMLRTTFEIAEQGAAHLGLLCDLRRAAIAADGRFFNKARVSVTAKVQEVCHGLRLEPVHGRDHAVPFLCLTSVTGEPLDRVVVPAMTRARYFAEENVLRFSFSRMGHRDDPPVDFAETVSRRLIRAIRDRR
jgi:hypothetical protein